MKKRHITRIQIAIYKLRNCTERDTTTAIFQADHYKEPFHSVTFTDEQMAVIRHQFRVWCDSWVISELEAVVNNQK